MNNNQGRNNSGRGAQPPRRPQSSGAPKGAAPRTNAKRTQAPRRSPAPARKSANTITINKKTVILAIIIILIIMNIIAFASLTKRSIPEKLTPSEVEEQSRLELDMIVESPFEVATITSSDYVRGTLALINTDYPYDFDYIGVNILNDEVVRVNTLIEDRNFKASDNTIFLATETITALNSMFKDFVAETGKKDVMIHSAHRTYEQQKSILDAKIKQLGEDQQIAQAPGNSEHHTGYGFDIMIYPDGGVGAGTFTGEGVYSWIYENCHKYGFILRYPEGKTEITGIAPESWHFRYVGVPHATYIYNHNITLEEYLSEVKAFSENLPLIVEVSESEIYEVYYVKKADATLTEFNIPKQTEYKISGDNVGGFVVWYEKSSESAQ